MRHHATRSLARTQASEAVDGVRRRAERLSPEPRRYSTCSVSGYSNGAAVVYKYSRYSRIGVDTADTADTAVIQQRYSSDIAAIQQMQQMQQIQQIQQQVQQLQCRYNNRPQ
jgi:hypothetical protein|eukprot:3604615-Prymnesium_polylepis.1